jgi:S1-C subfamily serine protease
MKIGRIKGCSVSIEKSDTNLKSSILIGSGFLTTKNGLFYAITNYHVVKSITKDQIILVGLNAEMKKQYALVEQTFTDEKSDIAVLQISRYVSIKNSSVDTSLAKPATVALSMFEKSDNIIEGGGAIIIGYPLGLGSEYTGNKPISRIGIIAQGPNNKTNTFLLDCISSHGNSGSPVFNEHNLKLIGMVTSFKSDNINLYDNDRVLRASLPDNSGITVCVTAEMIMKIIP